MLSPTQASGQNVFVILVVLGTLIHGATGKASELNMHVQTILVFWSTRDDI